jgi:predicted MFS family arabinose efflux permease
MNAISQSAPPLDRGTWKHVWEERNMKWYFGTQLISLTGMMLRSSLLQLLMIDKFGKVQAAPYVGMIGAFNVLPGIFIAIFVGIAVDRFDKRNILRWMAVFGFIQASVLAYLSSGDIHDVVISHILEVALLGGFMNIVDSIARTAIIQDALMDKKKNGRVAGVIFNALYTVGIAAGGGLAAFLEKHIGYPLAFMMNSLSYVVLLVGLQKMNFSHNPPKEKQPWSGIWKQAQESVSFVFTNTALRICILLSASIIIFGFIYFSTLSLIAENMLKGTHEDFSRLAALGGIGSLVGSLVAIQYSNTHPVRWIIGGILVMGTANISLAFCSSMFLANFIVFFCGAGFMLGYSPFRGALMEIVGSERLARVLSVNFAFFYLGMTVNSWAGGQLIKHIGCAPLLLGCGVSLLLVGIIARFLPGMRHLN